MINAIVGNDRQRQIASIRNGLVTNEWLVSFTDKEIVNFAVGQPVIVSIRSRKQATPILGFESRANSETF